MQNICNRIKAVRTKHGLTQQEFADRLGINRSNIANYENGARTPVDAVISLICREFNINETWLRTGEGEMLQPVNRDAEIAAFMGDVLRGESEDFRRRLVGALAKLSVEEWAMLEKLARDLAEENKNGG